jgi:hypothetical protein
VLFGHGGEYLQIEDVGVRPLWGLQFQLPTTPAEFAAQPLCKSSLFVGPLCNRFILRDRVSHDSVRERVKDYNEIKGNKDGGR